MTDYDIRRQIKHEWLKQVVSGYGDPGSPEITSPLTKQVPVTLPNAYHADNGFALRLLLWHSEDIDNLAALVTETPSMDWWPLLTLPSRDEVEKAKRMEKTEKLPPLGWG